MKPAGLVLAAMAGLWIAYLVPHWLRYRQQLLECRADDRFSEQLRVIRVAGREQHAAGGPARPAQVLLHPPGARGRGGTVDRPHSATDRATADAVRRTAADRARQAQLRAVRQARARRRAVLAAALLLLTVSGWVAVAVAQVALALAIAPTVLLASVLVLGRRAVVVARRQDAAPAPVRVSRSEARAPARVARRSTPMAVGRAVRPSDADTEIIEPIVIDVVTPAAPLGQASPAEQRPAAATATWVPVPVPAPAYTLKPAVRRAEPLPLVLDEAPAAASASARATVPAAATAASAGSEGADTEAPPSLDLDAVLARRRAAGE